MSTFKGSFSQRSSALARSNHQFTSESFFSMGCCIFVRKIGLLGEFHLFGALLAGNVAHVQDLIDGIDYIFIFGQLLCCANQTASLVHLTLQVFPHPIRIRIIISTVTDCTMAMHS